MNPRYPVYIPSKGRWESRKTSKALEKIGVPYSIVVEPGEYNKYAAVIDPSKILVLPRNDMKLIGARCWIMEHSISRGAERHWQLDDNITSFYRSNQNKRHYVGSGTIFRAAEDFTDRYINVAYSGFNYVMFVKDDSPTIPPFYLNTRIYSCTLVNNYVPYRWRSIYNDDTDVCLCALKDGWCTILFNAFLAQKMGTMILSGGNTNQLYQGDGRLKMAQALVDLHPEVTTITWKFGRWQHQVDYSPFKKNKLIRKNGLVIPKSVNNYGMVLRARNCEGPTTPKSFTSS